MKVLFLDIDGVLNNDATKDRYNSFVGIDPKLVVLLNQVLARTGAKVVISSSWRHYFPEDRFDELGIYMQAQGFVGDVIGKTPEDWCDRRGLEIQEWLQAHPEVTSYAIVDDHSYHMRPMGGQLVQTPPKKGLEPKHVELLVKKLNEGRPYGAEGRKRGGREFLSPATRAAASASADVQHQQGGDGEGSRLVKGPSRPLPPQE